jgi:hypothetical protein
VFGSTVVMLLWILIYSFFASSDFVNEVIILFGELTFWTTVLFSAIVALGMSFHFSLNVCAEYCDSSPIHCQVRIERLLPIGQGHCS